MRRVDREITDPKLIFKIIKNAKVMRLGFVDDGEAYIVPLNFGYEIVDDQYVFYFHGANAGRKYQLIVGEPVVSFEIDDAFSLKEGNTACTYSAYYQSIMGKGKIEMITLEDEKISALNKIMTHYTGKSHFTYQQESLKQVVVFKLKVESLSCKVH